MTKYRIASIPADGIGISCPLMQFMRINQLTDAGIEVVAATIQVVEQLAAVLKTFEIEFTHIPWGTAYYKKTGKYVDDDVLSVLRGYDATLFGSVGAPGKFEYCSREFASNDFYRRP